MVFILLFLVVSTILYILVINPHRHWSKKKVRTGKIIPLFGDSFGLFFNTETNIAMYQRLYQKFKDIRFIGSYEFLSPVLIVRSPDLLKQICVKDFNYFNSRRRFFLDHGDDVVARNLLMLKGEFWKDMRVILSPTFTKNKLRGMFKIMCQNAEVFVQNFLEKNLDIIEIDFKDAYIRLANDIMASACFGIKVDSLNDRDNEFFRIARYSSNLSTFWMKMKLLFYQFSPFLCKVLKISLVGQKAQDFFVDVAKEAIKFREEHKPKANDALELLIEFRNKRRDIISANTEFAQITDEDIAAQLFIFLLAGVETTSTGICFMAYELALNPGIQKKLRDEIDQNILENGMYSYEIVESLTYLDLVTTESLRKWPPVPFSERVVTQTYTIQPEQPNEQPVTLDEGTLIILPIYNIHHDPKYYKNPEKFDPGRFSQKNRDMIDHSTYLPFGVGPRHCIGGRFAVLEIKTIIVYLLSNFEILPSSKTPIPMRIKKGDLFLTSEKGFPLTLRRRNRTVHL